MNYYPNFYNAGNNSSQYTTPYQMPQQYNQIQNQLSMLNGKFVDGIEMVRATEVPVGGYGIFPKADLSEIYIKSWNNNGTTSIVMFKPTPIEPVQDPKTSLDVSAVLTTILTKIEHLESELTVSSSKEGE